MKPVRLLAISASPRKQGNTAFLLEEGLKEFEKQPFPVEVERYDFFRKKIQPCIACLKCYTNGGKCILPDDFEELRQKWLQADAVLYSVPVYVVGIPGQLKCFLDRLHNATGHYYTVRSVRHMKPIGCIAQGCDLSGGQELAMLDIMRHASLINSLYISPDGSYIGAGGWADGMEKELLRQKAETDTRDIQISIQAARSVVRRTVEAAAVVKAGACQLAEALKPDARYGPLLARSREDKEER